MTSNTSPITTAREALAYIAENFSEDVPDEVYSRADTGYDAITAALDLAERRQAENERMNTALEVTQDEGLTEIARLTSQLEQAEKVIAPFADAAKAFAPVISDSDWCPIDFVCGKDMAEITVQVLSFRAASQWIKDRQAKGEG